MGKDVVAIASGCWELLSFTVMLSALEADRLPESVTVTVKSNLPASVGVPLIVPLVESPSPVGSEPEIATQV